MRQRFAIITGWTIIILAFCVFISNAFPPTPPVSGLSSASSVLITGGNITGITTLGATNATLTSANITTTDINGGSIDGTAIGANSPSTGAFTTLSASGQITGVPSATAPIMFGNTTAVNTTTDGTFPTADKTQINKTGAFTNAAVGDLILITGGTGATTGQYRLTTRTSADSVKVDRNIHASGTDITDGAFTVYKDIISVSPTDATNRLMITGWSHTNKPLQIGGSTLATPTAGATGTDVFVPSGAVIGLGNFGKVYGDDYNTYLYAHVGGALFLNHGTNGWRITPHLLAISDNTNDIGATGEKRPRNIYLAAPAITAGSGTGVTVNSTGNIIQQVYKVTTTYAAYSDSDLTKGIVIATLPAKTRLVAAYADTTVAYAGTDITAATLKVGVTAEGAAEILATHNVFAGAILAGDADAEMGTAMTRAAKEQGAYMPSFTETTNIYATIDATTGAATTLANLTAGSTTFYLITERLP